MRQSTLDDHQDSATRGAYGNKHAGIYMNENGYIAWYSHHDYTTKCLFVHRLLAVAEYGFDALYGKVVHHRNDIPWLNYPDNIELMSRSEHAQHHQSGAGGSNATLTEEEAREVKRLIYQSELTQAEIGDRYGITQTAVSKIKLGVSWGHLPDPE